MGLKVLKAKKGDELRKKLEDKMADAKVSEDAKKQVIALRDSYINDQKSAAAGANGGYSNREARILQNDFYNRALAILDGQPGYSEVNPNLPQTNIFGGYSHQDMTDIGNNITKNFYEQNNKPVEPVVEESEKKEEPATWHNYDWKQGYYESSDPNATVDAKRTAFLNNVIKNMQTAIQEYENNKQVKFAPGVNPINKDTFAAYQNTLTEALGQNWKLKATYDKYSPQIENILQAISDNDVVAQNAYKNYFTYTPSEREKYLKELADAGWSQVNYMTNDSFDAGMRKYLQDKHVTLFQNNTTHKYQALSDDLSGTLGGLWYINTDPNDADRFGWGLHSNDDGEFIIGDFQNNRDNQDQPHLDAINNNIKRMVEAASARFVTNSDETWEYNPVLASEGDPFLDAVYYDIQRANANGSIDAVRDLTAIRNAVDVSRYFNGNGKVLAMRRNNAKFRRNQITDEPIYDNDTIYYYEKADGSLGRTDNFQEVIKEMGGYNPNGNLNTEENNQLGINGMAEFTGQPYDSFNTTTWLEGWRNDVSNRKNFDMMAANIMNPEMLWSDDFKALIRKEKPFNKSIEDTMKKALFYYARNGVITINQNQLQAFRKMAKDLATQVPTQEQGGVIKALNGTTVSVSNTTQNKKKLEDAERETKLAKDRAKQAGYNSIYQMEQGEKNWLDSPSTYAQITAVTLDLASLITAIVPEKTLTAAASMATGLGSTISSFVGDIMYDGLDWGDIKNLGVNALMDVAAPWTGGATKLGKIVKTVTKLAPLAIGFFNTIQNGQEYIHVLNKFINGEGRGLTVNEFRTLAQGFSLITGATRTGVNMKRVRKIQNEVKQNYKNDKKVVPISGTDKSGNQKRFDIKPEDAQKIAEAKDYDEANKLFQQIIGNTNATLTPQRNSRFGHGFKEFFNPKNSTENPLAAGNMPEGVISPFDLVGQYYASPTARELGLRNENHKWATSADRALGNAGFFGLRTNKQDVFAQLKKYKEKSPRNTSGTSRKRTKKPATPPTTPPSTPSTPPATPTATPAAPVPPPVTPPATSVVPPTSSSIWPEIPFIDRNGGRLERLQNYIKNK